MADTTIIDDNHRLLRLISLVGWTAPPEENRASVRWLAKSAAEKFDQRFGTPLAVKLHRMVANYAGAVHRFRDGVNTMETQFDTRDLPGLALETLTGIADDALAELGTIVAGELAPGSEFDALAIGACGVTTSSPPAGGYSSSVTKTGSTSNPPRWWPQTAPGSPAWTGVPRRAFTAFRAPAC